MKKIALRKAFTYVCAFLLTICALLAFAMLGEKPVKQVQTASAATFTTVTGHSEWKVADDNGGSVLETEHGYGWRSSGAFQLQSTKQAWVDKFGLAFRVWKPSNKFRVIIVPDGTKWYKDQTHHIIIEFEYTASTSATVGVYVDGSGKDAHSNLYVSWDNSYENDIYLSKTSDTAWGLSVGGSTKSLNSAANTALNAVLSEYTDKVGYVQIENLGEGMEFTYVSVLFGMPVSNARPSDFNMLILNEPNWTPTVGTELAAWSPKKGTPYTVTSSTPVAFKGLDVTLRMAPAESQTRNIIAFSSLYKHNWYSGTYTIALNFDHNPAVHGNSMVQLEIMVYTPTTEASKEQPIKLSQLIEFNWYGPNRFEFYKYKGEWMFEVNDTRVFSEAVSSDGMTLDDYFKLVEPYYEGNKAYFQMWGRGDGVSQTGVPYDGIVVESMKRPEATSNDVTISYKGLNFAELASFEFKTNVQLRVAMSDLFAVAGVTGNMAVDYFATCGKIQSNGVWAYTARGVGRQWITFKCIAGGEILEYRVELVFIQGPAVVAPETASQDVSFVDGEMTVENIGWTEADTTISGGGAANAQGCGSSVAGGAAFALVAVAAVLATKKRRGE